MQKSWLKRVKRFSIIKVIEPFNPERPWEYAIAEFKWLESSVSDFVSKDEVFIPELEN
jgi:hypothetical protein